MDVKLVVQKGGGAAQVIRLRTQEMIIGRQKGCGVRIPSAQVSRQHCLLSYKDDLLAIEDLASANGTFVNGQRVMKRQILRPGDKLTVGPVTMLVQYQITEAAVQRLLHQDEEVVGVALDDVDVVAEDDDAQVELVLDNDDDAPLIVDDEPITLDPIDEPSADPLEALRAIEAKATRPPAPRPPRKAAKPKPAPDPFEETSTDLELPPPQRVKLTNIEQPAAAAAPEEDAGDDPSPDASQILGQKNWQLPTGEDIRDILAQIEKGKKKS